MTKTITPILPILSINGTSKNALIDGYVAAISALQEAEGKLRLTLPHGRDYQGDTERYVAARKEHADRVLRLQEITEEIEAIALGIQLGGR